MEKPTIGTLAHLACASFCHCKAASFLTAQKVLKQKMLLVQHEAYKLVAVGYYSTPEHTFVAIGNPSRVIKPPMLPALTVLLDRVRPSGPTPRST